MRRFAVYFIWASMWVAIAGDLGRRLYVAAEARLPQQRTEDTTAVAVLNHDCIRNGDTASHAPTLSIVELAGLEAQIDGRAIKWRRDVYNTYAFHLDVPTYADRLTLPLNIFRRQKTLRCDRRWL